jgi:hypothetical protein
MAPARFGSTGAMTSANSAHAEGASEDPAMTQTPKHLGQDPQYEPFLYAPVGEDLSGASVTVLSMLARLGVDPWGEASALSGLSEGAARQRLELLMGRFHDVSTDVQDRGNLVSGLLAVLPRRGGPARASSDGATARLSIPPQGSAFYWIVVAALFLGWIAILAQGQ